MAIFSKNIDMLNGTIWDKMVVFAIPLALTDPYSYSWFDFLFTK